METLLGLVIIYALIHFSFIQFKRTYAERSTYEKVLTWVALVGVGLVFYGLGMQ